MVYAQQRRKAMNKAVRALYPDIEFYESPSGIPVMECGRLPEGAVQIMDADDFIGKVKEHCRKSSEIGLYVEDYHKALPVFIRSMELTGLNSADVRHYYRVNYVSATEASRQRAAEYIAEGKLYAVV